MPGGSCKCELWGYLFVSVDLDCLELRKCKLGEVWLCLQCNSIIALHSLVSTCHFFLSFFFSQRCLVWMSATPQYLLGSRRQCICVVTGLPSWMMRVFAFQDPEICCSIRLPAVCFSFATGNHVMWLKLGYLGNTCGLGVRFADNVRMLFLARRARKAHFCSSVSESFTDELWKLNFFRCVQLRCSGF